MKLPSWLNPRTWSFERIKPGLTQGRDFLVTNRNAVLASLLALFIGLWGGAAMGRLSAAAPASSASMGAVSQFGQARSADAPRAGASEIEGMAFVRLRTEMGGSDPRACLEFSRDLSTDPSVNYSDYIELDPAAPFQTDVSGNLLCLSGLPFEPDRNIVIREGGAGRRTLGRGRALRALVRRSACLCRLRRPGRDPAARRRRRHRD